MKEEHQKKAEERAREYCKLFNSIPVGYKNMTRDFKAGYLDCIEQEGVEGLKEQVDFYKSIPKFTDLALEFHKKDSQIAKLDEKLSEHDQLLEDYKAAKTRELNQKKQIAKLRELWEEIKENYSETLISETHLFQKMDEALNKPPTTTY